MHDEQDVAGAINRRGFLGTGAGALAAATAIGGLGCHSQPEPPVTTSQEPEIVIPTKLSDVLPRRALGRTGVEVTILNMGTGGVGGLDRLLRLGWASGIRCIDTAENYGSEPIIGRWLQATPDARKEVFLVAKDRPQSPRQLLKQLDTRLASIQTDYVDLLLIHALGDKDFTNQVEWPRSREFKETAEAIRRSGKARFVGFSSHHVRRPEILQNAVAGGFVDVIMVQNNPWIAEEADMNRALDAVHKAGIGLISMKQVAGNVKLEEIARRLPGLKEKGLSPYQGLLHAIWTDERFSTCCVSMRNTDQMRENVEAARVFKPLTKAEIIEFRDACIAAGPTMCADCTGQCSLAGGTTAELGNITRFLTYHEHHGDRGEAKRLYNELSDAAQNWAGADLDAARQACPNKLDFARLLPRADQLLRC